MIDTVCSIRHIELTRFHTVVFIIKWNTPRTVVFKILSKNVLTLTVLLTVNFKIWVKMDLIGLIGVISSDPPFLGTCQDSWQYFLNCYFSIPTTSTTSACKNISVWKLELETRNQLRCGGGGGARRNFYW